MDKKIANEIKMYQANDWEIKEDTPTHVLMTKNTASGIGHLIIFLIAGWWTIGLANLIYFFCSNKRKKVIK